MIELMDATTKYFGIIADYLYNDMTQEERREFEKQLLKNKDLANEYEIQASVIKYIKSKTIVDEIRNDPDLPEAERLVDEYFKARESKPENEQTIKNKLPSRKLKVFWFGAAAAVLIGLFTTISLINHDPYAALYNKYYSPFDETSLNFRGSLNDEINLGVSDGIQFYINNDYKKSLSLFKKLENSFPQDPIINLYIGLNLMSLEQYEDAIAWLENYLGSFEVFRPEVKWYLSLCYLKSGNIKDAALLLEELENYQGKLGEDSRKLKHKIEKHQ